MSVYMFTHVDLDAVGSIVAAKQAKLLTKSIEYHSYDTIDQTLVSFLAHKEYQPTDLLLITDICPSEETCEKIDKVAGKEIEVKLLDHHATRSWVNKYPWATCDTDKSGAKLTLNYLFPKEKDSALENFIEAVNAWDLWKLDSPYRSAGERLNSLLYLLGKDEFVEAFSKNVQADKEERYIALLEYSEKRKKKFINAALQAQYKKARVYIDGLQHQFLLAFATEFISDVAHALLEDPNYNDVGYVVVINPIEETCSIRSKHGVHAGNLAKKFGGGGHDAAAGFPLRFKEEVETRVFHMLNALEDQELENRAGVGDR